MSKFFTSVRLDEDLCKGCINCIKRCPTQAIRVRNGKAFIIKEFCIDCGECIRICPHHAKIATYDPLDILNNYKYKVALPAPSLYGQVNNLEDVNILLTALKRLGFDDVFEVSAAAEIVSAVSRKYINEHRDKLPFISTACPSVTRLIRVRFPSLIEHLLPVKPPVEIAAEMALERAMKNTGLRREDIGIIFISPCASKVSAVKSPLGYEKSEIDAVVAIKDIYPPLVSCMNHLDEVEELSHSGKIGIGWGAIGGEAGGLLTESYLSADGIENVIRVLEDLEDQKFQQLEFIELNACSGGCTGGVLTVENPYIARVKLKQLGKYKTVACNRLEADEDISVAEWSEEVEYEPVFRLGNSMKESIGKMNLVNELMAEFPGLDCGSCGAPTCRALAEDIVRGDASKNDCIHVLREYIHRLSGEISRLDIKKDLPEDAGCKEE